MLTNMDETYVIKCNAELVGSKFNKSCCQKKLLDLKLERILSVMYKVH